MLIQMWIL